MFVICSVASMLVFMRKSIAIPFSSSKILKAFQYPYYSNGVQNSQKAITASITYISRSKPFTHYETPPSLTTSSQRFRWLKLRYATAKHCYGYFGREGLSWQGCFTRQTQMIKILLYGNDVQPQYVSYKKWVILRKPETLFYFHPIDQLRWCPFPASVLVLPELRFAF